MSEDLITNKSWGLYSSLLFKRGQFTREADGLQSILGAIYLHANGATNPGFVKELRFLAPGALAEAGIVAEEAGIGADQVKALFLAEAQHLRELTGAPLSPTGAWRKVWPELEVMMADDDDEVDDVGRPR